MLPIINLLKNNKFSIYEGKNRMRMVEPLLLFLLSAYVVDEGIPRL